MPPESTPSKGGGMMSLYANLLDQSANSPGTISRAPVVFKQSSENDAQSDESAATKQQLNAGISATLVYLIRNRQLTYSSLHSFTSFPTDQTTPTRKPETETEAHAPQTRSTSIYQPRTCPGCSTDEKYLG